MALPLSTSGLSPAAISVLESLGVRKLDGLQEEVLPLALQQRDALVRLQHAGESSLLLTLPIVERLDVSVRAPQALVLAPTREACHQLARDVRRVGRYRVGLQVLPVVGGEPLGLQTIALEYGVHVVVGTPGRVLDHHRRGTLPLDRVAVFVLQEADRMLDLGFRPDVEKIVALLPAERQTLLFSTTLPPLVEDLAARFQTSPARIGVEEPSAAMPQVEELGLLVGALDKAAALRKLLKRLKPATAVVFCSNRPAAQQVVDALGVSGVYASLLSAEMEQRERERVMVRFRSRSIPLLVTTDAGVKNLDLGPVSLVVSLEIPTREADYVHRLRLAAHDAAGGRAQAVALVAESDRGRLRRIEQYTRRPIPLEPLEEGRSPAGEGEAGEPLAKLWIGGGRQARLRAGDILGALTGEGGVPGGSVGKIEVGESESVVEVAQRYMGAAIHRLTTGKIKGMSFPVRWLSTPAEGE